MSVKSSGVTRHLSHEMRHENETRYLFILILNDEIYRENSLLFNWKTQNAKKVHYEINLYFMKLNFFF